MPTQLRNCLGTALDPSRFLVSNKNNVGKQDFDTKKHNLKDNQVIYKKDNEKELRGDVRHSWIISWKWGGAAQFKREQENAIEEVRLWLQGLGVKSQTFEAHFSDATNRSGMNAGQLKSIIKEAQQELNGRHGSDHGHSKLSF